MVDLIMPTKKLFAPLVIFAPLAVVAMAGICQAQDFNPLMPLEKAAVVAAQTSSATNYALLEPIANKRLRTNSGMLSPLHADATEKMQIGTADKSKIVVTPMAFKRGVFDEHQFKVQNLGTETLRQAKVLFTAPVGSVVQQVSPKPDSVDGSSILVTVDQIAPGQQQMVEITINYPRNKFAKFESTVIAENWAQGGAEVARVESLEVEGDSNSGVLTNMLQPKSSIVQEAPVSMLRPKVPAIMASTKSRSANVSANTSKASSSSQSEEDRRDVPALKSYLHGPSKVTVGEVNDYSIDIQNLAADTAKEIIVQLSIPAEMKVTLLDRDAWYDAKERKITWKLETVKGRSLEKIRYKAVIKTLGSAEQTIVVGMNGSVQGSSSLKTTAKKK